MTSGEQAIDLQREAFREVVRHPEAHAIVLGTYRLGEYAGVVALDRLLGELEQDETLRRAMEIHRRDEDRHTRVFGDWIRRLGLEPDPLPTDVEAYFASSPEEFRQQRAMLDLLTPEERRIAVFAGINAVERLAYDQFEHHLLALERPSDVAELRQVIREEKFHLRYVEAELDRQMKGEWAAFVESAVIDARRRFARFNELRRGEVATAIEHVLGGSA